MSKILKIFKSDRRRLTTNVTAIVIVIGLSVLPCLYAWFNIFSNWDPYGEDATKNLSIAVASEDKGSHFREMDLNEGDKVLDALKGNQVIHWVFTESGEEAVEGVKRGDYYAALVIHEDFTENILSFLSGNLAHPVIRYYENDKKNAIAPKITAKVKTAIQKEINGTFIDTLSTYILKAGRAVQAADGSDSLLDTGLNRLRGLSQDVESVLLILDSGMGMLDSAEALMGAAKQVTGEMGLAADSFGSISTSAGSVASGLEGSLDMITAVIDTAFAAADKELSNMISVLDVMDTRLKGGSDILSSQVESLKSLSAGLANQASSITVTLEKDLELSTGSDAPGIGVDIDIDKIKSLDRELAADFSALDERFTELLGLVGSDDGTKKEAAVKVIGTLRSKAAEIRSGISSLRTTYDQDIRPAVSRSITKAKSAVDSVKDILNTADTAIARVSGALGAYPDVLGMGRENLIRTRDSIKDLKENLDGYIRKLSLLSDNENYNKLKELLQNDPEFLASFVSEPVKIEEQTLFAIENNGSATAPFYLVLSMWVGALILVAIIHVNVKEEVEIGETKNYQRFYGRYLIFFLIGQIQTLITMLGAFFFLGIQCQNYFLMWLAGSVISFTFTSIMYSLTYGFGAVGEAIAVVLMVLQVAGAGGTFPIEVLPKLYQMIYRFMPFPYAMNALRECVAGFYGNRYLMNLGILLLFAVLFMLIGMICHVLNRGMHHKIEEVKAKTDLMI